MNEFHRDFQLTALDQTDQSIFRYLGAPNTIHLILTMFDCLTDNNEISFRRASGIKYHYFISWWDVIFLFIQYVKFLFLYARRGWGNKNYIFTYFFLSNYFSLIANILHRPLPTTEKIFIIPLGFPGRPFNGYKYCCRWKEFYM